jgi:hypothetical protein
MKVFIYLFISVMMIFFAGCESETPESRFNIFIEAALEGDRLKVENCMKKFSIDYLKHDLAQAGMADDWLEKLMSDTRLSRPVYQKTEWIVRNRLARVFFSHSEGRSDYLLLERHEGRWYIDLFRKQEPVSTEELPEFVISSQH